MTYWIIIDSWNLMETFVTESLSPHNFYEKRNFGNDLTRFISKEGESYTDLVLYTKEPTAKYAIQIEDSILDMNALKAPVISKRKTKGNHSTDTADFFYYPKTIYFHKGFVRFRFEDETTLSSFIAESRIIIEVKTIEKYKDSFFVEQTSNLQHLKSGRSNSLGLETDRYIDIDNYYNALKGGLIAYACGVCTNTNKETQDLLLALTELKNNVAGLNTEIMLNGDKMPNFAPSILSMAKVRAEYSKLRGSNVANSLEVLKHILDEIRSISMQRFQEITRRNTPEHMHRMESLKKEENECQEQLQDLESQNIWELELRLNDIKSQEVENGKKEGKKRKYFKKGTVEYEEKVELKNKIEEFKKGNSEYKTLIARLKDLREMLSDTGETTKYDATLSSLFVRVSDNINDIVKAVQNISNKNKNDIDFSAITFQSNFHINIDIDGVGMSENNYFTILANYLLHNPNGKQSSISEATIIKVIAETGLEFKNRLKEDDEEGQMILSCLRQLWKYKNQQSDSFSIPENLKGLQAALSFMVKPRGFDQIDRFMRNRSYPLKEYSFMLLGLIMGYAALPKTLTNVLYDKSNSTIENTVEKYLIDIEKTMLSK